MTIEQTNQEIYLNVTIKIKTTDAAKVKTYLQNPIQTAPSVVRDFAQKMFKALTLPDQSDRV